MIPFTKGEPSELKPGMCIVYSCGKMELVGSQKHIATGPIIKHYQAVQPHWLEWAEDMAKGPKGVKK